MCCMSRTSICRRIVSAGLAILLFSGCGGDDASQRSSQPAQQPAATVAMKDYSLLLFLPRLAAELKLDAAQRVTLAVWRPDFQRQLKTATHQSGKAQSEAQLLEAGTAELKRFGERVEQILSDAQKSVFLKLRSGKRISGVQLEQSATGQIGVSYSVEKELRKAQSRFRLADAIREIDGIEDVVLVLNCEEIGAKEIGARWLLVHEDVAQKRAERVRNLLRSLVDVKGEIEDPVQQRTIIEAFCLLARREDAGLLLKFLESSTVDWETARLALKALIHKAPGVASALIRERLDDAVWHDETLALLEQMDRDAFATLGLMSDILHPNWRERLVGLLRAAGRETSAAVVTEYRIEWSLKQFGGSNSEYQNAALAWLAAAQPSDVFRDSRVTCLLRPLLATTWGEEERPPLAAAFSHWAGQEDVPVLMELLQDYAADRETAGLAVDALLRLDPVAIRDLLAPPGRDGRFRVARNNPYSAIVRERLAQPIAHRESALIQLFEAPDEQVRAAICRALARNGGDRSEQFLSTQLAKDGLTELLRGEVARAIERIRSR